MRRWLVVLLAAGGRAGEEVVVEAATEDAARTAALAEVGEGFTVESVEPVDDEA